MNSVHDSLLTYIEAGEKVLAVWTKCSTENEIEALLTTLRKIVGASGSVHLEHSGHLHQANYASSAFDSCVVGFLSPEKHQQKLVFIEVARLLKPSGQIFLFTNTEPNSDKNSSNSNEASMMAALKLSGFIDVVLKTTFVNGGIVVQGKKPGFEVGSSRQLKFPKKDSTKENVKLVWSLDIGNEDVELVDDEDLLDQDDMNKPTDETLRVNCNLNEKKRKACINCTCGLADSISVKQEPVASSCGSCYLGDAFRCASCPYLGMPAFKPGENVKLTGAQMQPDT